MKRKSNWLKNLLQWGTLAAIVGFVVYGLTLGEKPADVEAYCPFGGLQALGSYLVNNSLACTMSMTQIMVGVMLAVGVILFSKLFCGYLCPLGTVSEWMGRGGKKLKVSVEIRPGSIADRLLRAVKYALLFYVFYMSASSSELFCKNFDPYYAVATGFKGEITVWIGKVITPIFLVFLAILVVTALINPSTSVSAVEPAAGYQTGALSLGFIEGYGTMDAIAGLAFGIVVIDIIRSMGVTDDSDVAKDVLSSGLLTSIPMIVIYVTTILMGTQSRGLFETSENGGIALAQISGHYLGRAGSLVLAVTITCACLKTAIGLVTSCSDAFSRMFPKGLSYRAWAVIFTVLSFLISNFGLSKIISYSLPLLLFLYPLAITLILLALFGNLFHHDRAVYVSVTAFTCIAALFDLAKALPANLKTALHLDGAVGLAEKILPFFDISLGWVLPAFVGLVLGLIIHFVKKQKAA